MKRILLMIALAAVLVLVGSLLWQGLHREKAPTSGMTSAALGLMLLEKESGAGLYVLAVTQESPADRAGVQPGDYLLRSGTVLLESSAQLDGMINEASGMLPITIRRGGEQLIIVLPGR